MADRIALLLHMHQPDYRDPETGRPHMPWVRLHATRGYTDVPVLAAEAGATPTINVVPSLLHQLQDCARGATDRWAELSRARAESLSGDDLAFVRARFVHGHPAMREASPRFTALAQAASTLSDPQELRDLQVWSNLAWIGVVGRRRKLVSELRQQDRDFSHDQLLALLALQQELVAGVLPLWREVASLSATPLTHPILPLLVDLKHARRCLPYLPEDLGKAGTFVWPQDARRQIVEGLAVCEQVLGRRPVGLWPSEGSVSPEILDMADELGLAWLATDEGVLHRSQRDRAARLDGPWSRVGREHGVRLAFRDHDLSDRIGFVYHRWDGQRAVEDLFAAVQARWGDGPGAVPVILDGENPWEAYPDAGEQFLTALFASGRVTSMDQFCQAPTVGRLQHLHTGSWIDADFRIWAGDEQDLAAWALVADLRSAWEQAGCPEDAWPHIANAESSDWFWWFGPEHHTEVGDLFDALFRAHLVAGWQALGQDPPAVLRHPISGHDDDDDRLLSPSDAVHPLIDGADHVALWAGAAELPVPGGGSMSRGRSWLHGGTVGVGAAHLYLRLEPGHDVQLQLHRPGQPDVLLAEPGEDPVRIVAGPGVVYAALPWSGDEVLLALSDGHGARLPEIGWMRLHPPPTTLVEDERNAVSSE